MLEKILGKSWRTTVAGIAAFVTVLADNIVAVADTDPATIADWNTVVATAVILFGLFNARDNKVTSEEAQAK